MNENTMENWGKDHWSTFAYIETLAVDNNGIAIPVEQRMRTNRRHASSWNTNLADKYPTILKNGEIEHHDDWDCLEDMVKEGMLIHVESSQFAYSLTPRGREIVNQLREHKSNSGTFKTFNSR